jgi:hypothetical protein
METQQDCGLNLEGEGGELEIIPELLQKNHSVKNSLVFKDKSMTLSN